MARRMQRALQFDQVQEAMQEIMELMAQMGMNKERLQQMRHLDRPKYAGTTGTVAPIYRPENR